MRPRLLLAALCLFGPGISAATAQSREPAPTRPSVLVVPLERSGRGISDFGEAVAERLVALLREQAPSRR